MDTNNSSMLSDNPETICPSCGRFVGTYERCPYCGREVKKRFTIRFMKIAAISIAFIGVLFLYLAALHKQLPLVRVSELKPTMNFAYVRVRGIAISDAYINDWGGFGFNLNDSDDGKDINSTIKIRAYSDIAKQLKDSGLMPSVGDIVEVAGSLKLREGNKTLTVQSPEQIKIFPVEVNKVNISDLGDESLIGQKLLIHGEITDFIPTHGKAPKEIIIQDQHSSVKLECWENVYKETTALKGMGYGAVADVKIYVDQYKGKIQYWLKKSTDIKIIIPSKTGMKNSVRKNISFGDITSISDIDKSMLHKIVTIQGIVKDIKAFGKTENHKAIIENNGSEIEVIMFSKEFKKLPDTVKKGNVIKVCGKVGEYKGKMQIIPDKPTNIKFVSGSSSDIAPSKKKVEIKKISDISESMKGNIVKTEGKIISISKFGKKNNYRVIINDGNAQIEIIFFASNFDSLPKGISEGKKIKVTGKVNVYNGKLQIIMDKSEDVEVF